MFLQDNCTCPQCFHASSQSRAKLMTTLNLDKRITSAEISKDKSSITLTWSDGHVGTFSEQWLLARSFSKSNQDFRRKGFRDDPKLVGSDHQIKRISFQVNLRKQTCLFWILSGKRTEIERVLLIFYRNYWRMTSCFYSVFKSYPMLVSSSWKMLPQSQDS